MDESVRAAMAKWPDVPSLSGWLSLDESGHWRLKGEPITHAGLVEFINRNYDRDEQGRWFFQNGPQRGFVSLDYAPWVLYVNADDDLCRHTGEHVEAVDGAWIDEEGNLLLHFEAGVGLVDSDSLPAVAEWLVDARGRQADADTLADAVDALQSGDNAGLQLKHNGEFIDVGLIHRADVPRRFGFDPDPRPDET
ncbi:MAG: DUF2946 family protein [Halofilum sp. (in: g-proteobacteria)]